MNDIKLGMENVYHVQRISSISVKLSVTFKSMLVEIISTTPKSFSDPSKTSSLICQDNLFGMIWQSFLSIWWNWSENLSIVFFFLVLARSFCYSVICNVFVVCFRLMNLIYYFKMVWTNSQQQKDVDVEQTRVRVL